MGTKLQLDGVRRCGVLLHTRITVDKDNILCISQKRRRKDFGCFHYKEKKINKHLLKKGVQYLRR